jgi:transcriptional regulator with XRE-family HTH domain
VPAARSPEAAALLREFGLRVRSFREAAGLSQEELGFRAGMHPTYVSGIERGRRNVSLLNLHALADGLAVPVGKLFSSRP